MENLRRLLGKRLRAVRKSQRLSQEELGERAELSGKFIGEVERGDKGITLDSLFSISKALGVPLRDIVDLTPEKEKAPLPEIDEVFALLRQRASAGQIKRAVKVLRALLE